MSCRQNHGNSAATSLAKFLSDSPEELVSPVFHAARRAAKVLLGETEAKAPADIAKVQDFLNDARSLARHDSRIPDARRESLLARIDGAQEDLINGENIPNKATFAGWVELRARLEEAQLLTPKHTEEVDPTTGFTKEGIKITKSEVDLAEADYHRLDRICEDSAIYSGFRHDRANVSERMRESINMKGFEVRIAAEKYYKLSNAYDTTDTGYELLLSQGKEDLSPSDRASWLSRKETAERLRSVESPIIVVQRQAEEIGLEDAKVKFENAKKAALELESIYKANRVPSTRNNYENAVKEAQHARRVFLYTILERPSVALVIESNNMRSPQSWDNLKGDEVTSQNEMWQAAEIINFDLDNAEVRVGKIREGEIARRAYLRAEARQSLLDSQGNGVIDPINRRYNETIRRLRGESIRSTVG